MSLNLRPECAGRKFENNNRIAAMQNVTIFSLAILILSLFSAVVMAAPVKQPNIVLIYADDLPWYGTSKQMEQGNRASTTGYQNTPNIDKLAEQGLTFTHSYATSPIMLRIASTMLCRRLSINTCRL